MWGVRKLLENLLKNPTSILAYVAGRFVGTWWQNYTGMGQTKFCHRVTRLPVGQADFGSNTLLFQFVDYNRGKLQLNLDYLSHYFWTFQLSRLFSLVSGFRVVIVESWMQVVCLSVNRNYWVQFIFLVESLLSFQGLVAPLHVLKKSTIRWHFLSTFLSFDVGLFSRVFFSGALLFKHASSNIFYNNT